MYGAYLKRTSVMALPLAQVAGAGYFAYDATNGNSAAAITAITLSTLSYLTTLNLLWEGTYDEVSAEIRSTDKVIRKYQEELRK